MKISFYLFMVGPFGARPFFKFMTLLTVSLLTLSYISCEPKPNNISGKVHQTPHGFAYRIFIDNKLAVQQETIPGISGTRYFCDSLDAARVCRFVQAKIVNRQNPSVTKKELDDLKINTKC